MDNFERILEILIKSEIPEIISQKINDGLDEFCCNLMSVTCHREFNDCIANFVQKIYGNDLAFPRIINSTTALAEAINLLDQHYENLGASGYDAAYLDAVDESGKGIEFVLKEIAEILKTVEISKWLNSFYASIVDPADKNQHLEIIKSLFSKYPFQFPENIKIGNRARYIKYYRDLIEIVVSSEKTIKRLAAPLR